MIRIEGGRFANEAGEHAPRTAHQGRTCGQNRCASHPARTTQHGHIAETALVRTVTAALHAVRKQRNIRQPGGCARKQRTIQIQIADQDQSRVIAAFASMQAGLVANEGDGVRGAHREAMRPDDGAGIGIQSARHIQRQHRTAQRIHCLDQLRGKARQRPFQPYAE